ncbi:MAG: hydroxypyruvate isomerase [Rhodocyclaceae bacterium]|nr:hydroxypyruvate isomerase [Rhodocyclaceae bacterium]
MPRFCANLTLLFTEYPFLERFAAAAAAGFRAVEFQFPYAFSAADIANAARREGLEVVLFNLHAGNWEGGDRGIACHPGRVAEFREAIPKAVAYALELDCPRLNCLAGPVPAGVSREEARAALLGNLRHAAAELAAAGLSLMLEPINSRDIPGFFVDRPSLGLEIIAEAGCPNLALQYDVYHAQVMEGNLARTLEANLARIGHIQIADNPGRHEPGSGEIAYPFLFRHLDAIGYPGWVGCEYLPAAGTEAGLGWLKGISDPDRC